MIDADRCLSVLRERRQLPDDTLAAFLVGSFARGWANSGSDYDIYIVTRDSVPDTAGKSLVLPLVPVDVPVLVTQVEGRSWEIKYWLDVHVDQMLAKVSRERFDADVDTRALSMPEELFLERVLFHLPLMGADWLDQRRIEIQESAYREFLVSRSLGEADKAVENAVGQLADSDVHSAILSARKAIDHTVDALLESLGAYGSCTPKWRARRFRDAAPKAVTFDDYWSMETMAGLDPGHPADWVERALTWCKQLAMEIEY